jgi:hypothetical protein
MGIKPVREDAMPVRTILLCIATLLSATAAAQTADTSGKGESKPAAKPAASKPAAGEAAKAQSEVLIRTAKKAECVVKPVMSDDDLRNCGARAPMQYEKPR